MLMLVTVVLFVNFYFTTVVALPKSIILVQVSGC